MIMFLEDLGLGFASIFELKPITTIFPGAGATFDWLFFDNSKLINFDC
jgi:hypothetical protein